MLCIRSLPLECPSLGHLFDQFPNLFLFSFKNIFYLLVCICISVSPTYVGVPKEVKYGIRLTGARVNGGFELLDMSARNQTQVLCESSEICWPFSGFPKVSFSFNAFFRLACLWKQYGKQSCPSIHNNFFVSSFTFLPIKLYLLMWFSVLLRVLFLFHTRLLSTRKCILYWYVNILQAPRKLDNIWVILLFSVSPNVWTSKSFPFKLVHLLYHFPRGRTNKQRILSGTFEHDSAILCWTFLSRLCYRALILVHLAASSCIAFAFISLFKPQQFNLQWRY